MHSRPSQAIELLPIFQERVWGRKSLEPFFPDQRDGRRIGEVWFTFVENATSLAARLGELITNHPEMLGSGADSGHPGVCPVLVKLIFTSERLSVQVHPDDEYAAREHQSLGKTEAWYVLDAQPPGELAAGFRERLTPEKLRQATLTGEIERLLDWQTVKTGDVIFVPAGTVHAIGAGLTICEIQENSDITYRLYDYGRPRELHLQHGLEVSQLEPREHRVTPIALAPGRDELVACRYFRIERLRPKRVIKMRRGFPQYLLLICIKGASAGKCWLIPAHGDELQIAAAGSEWILTYTAQESAAGVDVD